MRTPPNPHVSRDLQIETPWTKVQISGVELQEVLQRPASVRGKRVVLAPSTAALYTYYLRDLIPHARTAAALAEALLRPTSTGLKPARHVLSTRRVAWHRFLATRGRTRWESFPWPDVPAIDRKARPKGHATFKNWWTPRSLGVGIRWLCARARARGLRLSPGDLRRVTAASLRTKPDGGRFLLVQRAVDLGTTRGEPEVVLPLARADLLVIAAMLHASWGDGAAKVPADQRLLIARMGESLPAERLGEICNRAVARTFDLQPFCGGAARADAVELVTTAVGLTPAPDPGTPVDLWGGALATVLARVAIREEVLSGITGAHARVLRFGNARGLSILQAFELIDRVTFVDKTLEQVDLPIDPSIFEATVPGADAVMDGVGARRHRAMRERVNAWRRERDAGSLVDVQREPLPGVPPPPRVTPPPISPPPETPPNDPQNREVSERVARLIAKRDAAYTPFSKEEKGRVK